ncbi:hypothetical protein [Salipiger abyssi]|uniref:hypothetical protein n=1 Tax=Salipiger abyssi TaxID=1250539 RepID=UPI004059C350
MTTFLLFLIALGAIGFGTATALFVRDKAHPLSLTILAFCVLIALLAIITHLNIQVTLPDLVNPA